MVFCRGFIDSEKIREILSRETGISPRSIWPTRKMGEANNEILILLRNPYGDDPKAYLNKGTLENRFCKVITLALQYMSQHPEDLFYEGKQEEKSKKDGMPAEQVKLTATSKHALKMFFFGPEGISKDGFGKTSGFAFELKEARRRLRDGEKPFFENPLRIFHKNSRVEQENKKKVSILDEDDIARVVDERIKELIQQGLIKGS